MKRAIAVLGLVLWAQEGFASFRDGNQILLECKEEGTIGYGYCVGYIASASDTAEMWANQGFMKKAICHPENVSQGQLRQIVVKFLEENPEKLHLSADSLVVTALIRAFPCP
jgi:hypothetical protein